MIFCKQIVDYDLPKKADEVNMSHNQKYFPNKTLIFLVKSDEESFPLLSTL